MSYGNLVSTHDPVGPVSVVVGTRNRGPRVAETAVSVLRSDGVDLELIVVDQSDDESTARSLDEIDDERLHVVRSDTVGVSTARNIGIRTASSSIVLITDDDVVVEPDWARSFRDALASAPEVVVAFCQVRAAPHDRHAGFVPAYEFDGDLTIHRLRDKHRIQGIGAGMGVRRDAALELGGFDERLGPGAPFRAAEDRDLAVRALSRGLAVARVSGAEVVHHGFRTWEDGRELTKRDWFGIGATYAKFVKARRAAILPVLAREVLGDGLLRPLSAVLRGRRPVGLRRTWYFASGMRAGWRTRLDESTQNYGAVDGGDDACRHRRRSSG